jgi:hypothetical protein
MSRRRACWRSGSTRPSGARGSCSRRAAGKSTLAKVASAADCLERD